VELARGDIREIEWKDSVSEQGRVEVVRIP